MNPEAVKFERIILPPRDFGMKVFENNKTYQELRKKVLKANDEAMLFQLSNIKDEDGIAQDLYQKEI